MTNAEASHQSLASAAAAVRCGRTSASQLVEGALTRIDQTDNDLGAFALVMADAARSWAAELDEMDPVGPLHGVPIALKDLIFTAGVPTEANCDALAGFTPDHNATVVQRLTEAGAVIIGKTNTHELAFGVSCPASHNPWDLDRMTGGSSGGSAAAVASGQVFAALGTDTGGSVRIPSSYCGITGIKTTRGLVPRSGVHLISSTYDTVGPMARSATDCGLLLEVLAGPSTDDPFCDATPLAASVEVDEIRLGAPGVGWLGAAPLDDEVARVLANSVETLRSIVGSAGEVELPAWEQHGNAGSVIVFAEAAALTAELRASRGDAFGEEVGGILEAGAAFSAAEVADAESLRQRFESEWLAVFDDVDVVLCPVTPNQVLPHGTETLNGLPLIPATTQFTFAVNGAGLPAIALPAGFDSNGMPIGVQAIGRPQSELTLVALGEAFQQRTDYHLQSPIDRK